VASIAKRPDGQWRARYRDDDGRERARHFDRKVDAQRWLDEVTATLVGGTYVDPTLGRQTFQAYAEAWRATQPHRPTTAKNVEQHLRWYAYDTLGDRPLAAIRPSEVQAWVTALSPRLAPSTLHTVVNTIRAVFAAAVRDRAIGHNPCVGVALPRVPRRRVEPLTCGSPAGRCGCGILSRREVNRAADVARRSWRSADCRPTADLAILDEANPQVSAFPS
jgi:hypothetical protein